MLQGTCLIIRKKAFSSTGISGKICALLGHRRRNLASLLAERMSRLPRGLKTRFAPSPTGYLHLGHVASAIYVWGLARLAGAEIILRIEDHDQARSRQPFEASILADLNWLGFKADRGVSSEESSPYRQSDHFERYASALETLGRDIYRCHCSRKDIQERDPYAMASGELRYDGHCRAIDKGPNVRLRIPERLMVFNDELLGHQRQSPVQQCGDLLLKDRDGFWTYNFAVCVDDVADDIGLIIRGQDILAATGRQIYLREKLGGRSAMIHVHHPLIYARPDHKLSKRDHATSIAQWRASGCEAEDVIGKAAFQVGLISEERPLSVSDLEALFL
jgi:glutamyl/glutaminyl-tRNA synthetase